jgi:hypothetical protein
MFRRALSRALPACGAAAVAGALIAGPFSSVAFATVTSGSQVPGSALPIGTYTKGTPFSSGQVIQIEVPSNSVFASGAGVNILECSDPGGLPANDPTNAGDCDGNTIQGNTVLAASDGSIDYDQYTVYALPDSFSLDEPPTNTPVCNTSNWCVLFIGEDVNDFTQPHVFSQPFLVKPNATDSGANPGDGLPEAPLAIGLPILGLGVIGGTILVRRRRSAQRAS